MMPRSIAAQPPSTTPIMSPSSSITTAGGSASPKANRKTAKTQWREPANRGGFRMRPDMVPGARFPDYELSDHTARHRKLSELQGQQPMVLVLSRGSFCPKDRRQAEGLAELHRELEVA